MAEPSRASLWSRLWPLSGAGYGILTLAGIAIAVSIVLATHGSSSGGPAPFGTPLPASTASASPLAPATPGPSTPVLAPPDASLTGQPIDGISCQAEMVLFHIHAHLAVYVDGTPRTVPAGIGITPPLQEETVDGAPYVAGGSCLYWLHSHTADGIIHIESPVQRTFTLGEYFDIWGVPLDGTHVGPATGTVVAYVNGQVYTGDIRAIPLNAHTLIQLDVNGNVPPAPFTFPAGD